MTDTPHTVTLPVYKDGKRTTVIRRSDNIRDITDEMFRRKMKIFLEFAFGKEEPKS